MTSAIKKESYSELKNKRVKIDREVELDKKKSTKKNISFLPLGQVRKQW